MRRKHLQTAAILLSGIMAATPAASFLPAMTAMAAVPSGTYVMMNIPYSEFYASDNLQVDAVTSATKVKTRGGAGKNASGKETYGLAAGSYHNNADGSDISGVIYPVKVDDTSILSSLKKVTGSSKYDITINLKGTDTTTTYEGADALFENAGDHAYYELSAEEISKLTYYKELTGSTQNGGFVFSETKGEDGSALAGSDVTVAAAVSTGAGAGARHAAYEITVAQYENGEYPDEVFGAVLLTQTSKSGGTKSSYALRHLVNIWRDGEFGIDPSEARYASAEGQWAYGLKVYTNTGIDNITFTEPVLLKKIGSNLTASASQDGTAITIDGIPGDAVNAKASVAHTVGRSSTAIESAQNLSISNGKITLPAGTLTDGETYTITVTSDNYSPAAVSITYQYFSDVPATRWSHSAILWAIDEDVTVGYPNGAFGVEDPTTREQAVQFIYNLNKKPAPESGDQAPTFTDVTRNNYSYDAIFWAVNHDVIKGYPDGTFGRKDPCTREQIVQMLYNLEKKPYASRAEAQKNSGFDDVTDRERWSYDAIAWAHDNKIVSGKGDGLFHAKDTCTREETVQIIYNYYNYKNQSSAS